MSTLQQALINAGLAKEPKSRKPRKQKVYKCKVCGSPMERVEGTNIMYCSSSNLKAGKTCKNFYIFGTKKSA